MTRARPRRVLGALAGAGGSVALAPVFAVALAAGLSLHAPTPALRRAAATIGNEVLAGLFEGTIVVRGVDELSLGRRATVRAKHVTIEAPGGAGVVTAEGVEATIDLRRLLSSVLTGGAPVVSLSGARIASAELSLDVDEEGAPRLARALTPRGPKTPASRDAPPGPLPYVEIAPVRVDHLRVRGDLVSPPLDGEVSDVTARVKLERGVVLIGLGGARVTLTSPRLPGQALPLEGALTGKLAVELDRLALTGDAELSGASGDVPVVLRGRVHRDDVEASLAVGPAAPEAVRAAFGGLEVRGPLELHAHARGTLPTLALDARARVGDSALSARGEIDLREGRAFKLDVEGSGLDAAALGADVATDLSATLHAEGVLGGAGSPPLVSLRMTTEDGTIAATPVPPLLVEARLQGEQLTATARASEPGVTATAKVVLALPSRTATFDLQARSTSLRELARAPGVLRGAASARVQGTVDLREKTVEAMATASGENVSFGAFTAKHLGASGRIAGPLAAPIFDAGFGALGVRVASEGGEPLVYPTAGGRAKIAFAPSPRIEGASFTVGPAGAPEAVTGTARSVAVVNGALEVQGVRVKGLGDPFELDVRVGEDWSVRAKSDGVDLRRAAALTGIAELAALPPGTRAVVDVDLRGGARGPSGRLDVVVRTEEDALTTGAVVAEAHATVTDGQLVGSAKLAAEGVGSLEIPYAAVQLPRRLDARSLRRATGVIDVRGELDLSRGAARLLGPGVERLAGIAKIEGRVERSDPSALPAARATIRTEGLTVAVAGAPHEAQGVDVLAHGAWDGRTEDAELAVLAWDAHGLLGSASGKAKLPLAAWATGAKPLDADAVADLVVGVVVDLPTRQLAWLPSFLGAPALRGQLGARLAIEGPAARPSVVVSARGRGLAWVGGRSWRAAEPLDPLDGTLEARWDGERAAITFSLDERWQPPTRARLMVPTSALRRSAAAPTKPPGHVRGLVLLSDMRMSELLRGRAPSALPWTASAEVEVANLALGALPLPGAVTGVASGRARVKGLNGDVSFEANARVDRFGSGGAEVEGVDVTVGGRDASLFAHASFADRESKGTLQVASQSLRVRGLDVSWEAEAPTRVDYAVWNGRLALLAPLVRGSISDLDGRVDGAGSVSIDAHAQTFEGGLAVQGASLYVNALGEEISALDATARFDRTGTVRIDGASGKMGSGAFRASATGRMKGLRFMGGEATVVIPREGGIPLSAEAVTFASATGEVRISASMSEDRDALLSTVFVPRAFIELPGRSTQALQPLDDDPTVAVGVRLPTGELDTRAVRRGRGGTGQREEVKSDALAVQMDVLLGDDVHLEGRGLDIALGGRTLVELANELSVSGRLDLRGGTIEVHGRRFQVAHGLVTFPDGGEASDPTIVASAYWDAPDRTRVWVDFVGPLRTGKLTLRSEPAYSKNEILSVLLFGRPDPNMATGAGMPDRKDAASGATAVGSGFLAGDLNRILAEIDPDLDVETDTLAGNRTRGKLGHSFFDRRFKVQVGYAAGGTYREPDTTYLFLNWQFVPKWSVVATAGDKGTSIVDLLFQHRY